MSLILVHFAGFWRRALGAILDELLTMLPSYLLGQAALYVIYFLFLRGTSFDQAIPEATKNFIGLGAGFFVSTPYEIGFHYWKGWTPGKRVLRVIVRDYKTKGPLSLKQCILRYFGKVIALIPFGAGFLMAAWDKEKRGLHDLIAGTVSYTFEEDPLE